MFTENTTGNPSGENEGKRLNIDDIKEFFIDLWNDVKNAFEEDIEPSKDDAPADDTLANFGNPGTFAADRYASADVTRGQIRNVHMDDYADDPYEDDPGWSEDDPDWYEDDPDWYEDDHTDDWSGHELV